MDTVLLVITENSGLIYAHVTVALLILAVYSFQSDRFGFSRFRVLLFGSVYALTPGYRIAWALSLSRLITVCFLAARPASTGIPFGVALLLLTAGIYFFSGDAKGLASQVLVYAAVFATLVLQGMFRSFYLEVESSLVLKIVSVYLGIFAVLFTLYQTLKGHERLLFLSGGASREELERQFRSEEDEDSLLGRLKPRRKQKKGTRRKAEGQNAPQSVPEAAIMSAAEKTPKEETAKAETPKEETAKAETPKEEMPKTEAPKKETENRE